MAANHSSSPLVRALELVQREFPQPLAPEAARLLRAAGQRWVEQVLPLVRCRPCLDCHEDVDGIFAVDHHAICSGHAACRRLEAINDAIKMTDGEYDWPELTPVPATPPEVRTRRRYVRRGDVGDAIDRLESGPTILGDLASARRAFELLEQVVGDLVRIDAGAGRCPFCETWAPLEALVDHVRGCTEHPAMRTALGLENLFAHVAGPGARVLIALLQERRHVQHELAILLAAVRTFFGEEGTDEAVDRLQLRCLQAERFARPERRRRRRSARARANSNARRALVRLLAGEGTADDLSLLRRSAMRVCDHLRNWRGASQCPACMREGVEAVRLTDHLEECAGHPAVLTSRIVRADALYDGELQGALPPRLWVQPLDPAGTRTLDPAGYWRQACEALEALERVPLDGIPPAHRRTLSQVVTDLDGLRGAEPGMCPWCGERTTAAHLTACPHHPALARQELEMTEEPPTPGWAGELQWQNDVMTLELAKLIDSCKARCSRGPREDERLDDAVEDVTEFLHDLCEGGESCIRLTWPDELWDE